MLITIPGGSGSHVTNVGGAGVTDKTEKMWKLHPSEYYI
jgi:hypothetical protein